MFYSQAEMDIHGQLNIAHYKTNTLLKKSKVVFLKGALNVFKF